MSRAPSLVSSLVLGLVLCASRPALAQAIGPSLGDMSGAIAASVGAFVYVVGGTVAFIALDAHTLPKGRLPTGVGVTQIIYASTFMAVGVAGFAVEDYPLGATFMGLGAGLAAVPIVDWSTRPTRIGTQTSLRLTPTSVQLSGTF